MVTDGTSSGCQILDFRWKIHRQLAVEYLRIPIFRKKKYSLQYVGVYPWANTGGISSGCDILELIERIVNLTKNRQL